MSTPGQVYLGDGLYARLEPNQMIVLSTERSGIGGTSTHWVGLEPEVFLELLRWANNIGWGGIVDRAAREHQTKGEST